MAESLPPDRVRRSLVLLGIIVLIAALGLAAMGNWPKVGRVVLSAGAYAALLLLLTRRQVRLGAFMLAGAAAGMISGVARPATSLSLVAAGALGAALLIGPLHWLALRPWSRTEPSAAPGTGSR